MRLTVRRVLVASVAFACICATAVVGYMLAGNSLVDSLYMVVITVSSVGYKESVPVESNTMKVFTIFVILCGTGTGLYIIGGILQMVTEGEVERVLDARRRSRGIDKLRQHVIVCGYGRMGQILARELAGAGAPFVVIEKSDDRRTEAEDAGCLVVLGDASDEAILKQAHVDTARSVATVLPDDATNVYITLSARTLNPHLIILARGELPSTEPKLLHAGADHVVLPAAIGGRRFAHMILRPATSVFLEELGSIDHINDDLDVLGIEISEVQVDADSDCCGRPLEAIEVEGQGAYLIAALRRATGEFIKRPSGDTVVGAGDIVVLVGHGPQAPRLTTCTTPAREIVWKSDDPDASGDSSKP